MKSLLLRADAGHAVGSGHLMRMIALGERHEAEGGDAWLVLGRDGDDFVDLAKRRGLKVAAVESAVGSPQDAKEVARLAASIGCRVCVIDGYRFSANYVQQVRGDGVRVVAIDDLDDDLGADLVVRPGPQQSPDSGPGMDPRGDLRGSRYALLRSEFLVHPRGSRPGEQHPFRLLVCFGGSDPTRSAVRILRCLPDSPAVTATVAIGSGYRDEGELERAAVSAGHRGHVVELAKNISDMAGLMAQADAAVCAAGTVLLELAYFACPALAFVVVDNQEQGARMLARDGCVLSGAWIQDLTDADIAGHLSELVGDVTLQRRLSSRFGTLVDGQGCQRVLEAMNTLLWENAA